MITGCSLPPELDDLQLSMCLDGIEAGDAQESVRQHLEQCPHCRERADRLDRLQTRLRNVLHRSECIAPELLRDYAWDLLPDEVAQVVAHHLSYCPYCTYEYVTGYYTGDTSGDDLFTHAASQVRSIHIAHAEPLLVQTPVPAVRQSGVAQTDSAVFQTGTGILISATSAPDAQGNDTLALEGLVSGVDTQGIQVNLWKDGRLVESVSLDPVGDFRIPGLPPGLYEIILNGPTLKIHIADLRIGRTHPSEPE